MPNIAKISGVAYANIAKVNGVAWADINNVNGVVSPDATVVLPTGIIVPYTAGAGGAPANWSLYGDANNYFIVGAGDTYAVDDNGAGDGQVTKTIPAVANHTGDTHPFTEGSGKAGTSAAGAHDHNFSFTYTPPYQDIYLIKADAGQTSFPQDSCIFSHQGDLSNGGSNIYTTANRLFRAAGDVSTGGSATCAGTTTSAGGHNHGTASGGNTSGKVACDRCDDDHGAHTHSTSVTITNNLYRYLLSCWSNTSGTMSVEVGTLALYESTTPPVGWAFCNGANGTPDMRNKFVEFCASESEADGEGTGELTATGTTEAHVNHDHDDGNDTANASENAYHQDSAKMPTHAAMDETYTWMPPYYALAWIMYTG